MDLDAVREFALSLPGTNEQAHFEYTSFRVNGKIFATAPQDAAFLNVFVGEELRAPAIAADPDAYQALPWGKKIVGLKILPGADMAAVRRLVLQSWKGKASKTVQAALGDVLKS